MQMRRCITGYTYLHIHIYQNIQMCYIYIFKQTERLKKQMKIFSSRKTDYKSRREDFFHLLVEFISRSRLHSINIFTLENIFKQTERLKSRRRRFYHRLVELISRSRSHSIQQHFFTRKLHIRHTCGCCNLREIFFRSLQIERNTIVVTVVNMIMKSTKFR